MVSLPVLQMTDVSLDARITDLEENGGGSGNNGEHWLKLNADEFAQNISGLQ